ncbi:MAG TPA: 3-isopropylmalate dehydratase small subunit [Bacteroidales bacterium]|nr:3-isopropylmalate dehydratase small subunit [Bacteroidales bacterium]
MPGVKFTVLESRCVPLPVENIDTDQIIPARYLTTTSRKGLGKHLFHDWRYDKNGEPVKEFVLNNPVYSGSILVAGKNFGCGSSREHAVWALYDYGFRAVISSFFADIFKNNALNNGLLPVVIPEENLKNLFMLIQQHPDMKVIIDLGHQLLEIPKTGKAIRFDINPWKKECLLNGMDDIDYLLTMKEKIEEFEKKHIIP